MTAYALVKDGSIQYQQSTGQLEVYDDEVSANMAKHVGHIVVATDIVKAGKHEAEIDEMVEMLEMVRSNAHKFSKDQGLFLWTTIFSDQGWIELSALIAKHKEKE